MGIATRLSFKAQGATRRVKRDDSTATHPMETFTTSSVKLRLKKADTEAMAKVIKEMISIVRLLPHGCLQLGDWVRAGKTNLLPSLHFIFPFTM